MDELLRFPRKLRGLGRVKAVGFLVASSSDHLRFKFPRLWQPSSILHTLRLKNDISWSNKFVFYHF